MDDPDNQAARITLEADALVCNSRWTVNTIAPLSNSLDTLLMPKAIAVRIDAGGISSLDTAGAWLLLQIRRHLQAAGRQVRFEGLAPEQDRLIEFVSAASREADHAAAPRRAATAGEKGRAVAADLVRFLAFFGETMVSLFSALRRPGKIRWQEIFSEVHETGVKALPIIGLLSFLMGVVFAYLGAVQLKLYGANIYIADMVGYSMLRELAPFLTAILVCGRTGSAFTAQIGTMKVREEVDALQTIGISPIEMLVLPKLLGLLLVMPLAAVYADILSVFGGMVMANAQLGLGFGAFIGRLEEAITYTTFMLGLCKTPVFAAIIAIVGCYQGFRVMGSAESVGRRTTISVVQSMFLVIVTDALFSVLFSIIGV